MQPMRAQVPFCSWGGYKLTYNFDAGYTDPDTGRFCLHPSFLEAEFTPPSQSADDGQGDMKVEQETVRGTEPSNNRTTVSHEQASASNQASVLFCQDTAGNPMLAAGISAEADLADMFEYMGQAVAADILVQRGKKCWEG
ncbi:TPA: hypothetical protein ACH3X2_009585 [Trebouxia sp. C0005]